MAGIGFKLVKLASRSGVGGTLAAAIHGAAISAGPWICMSAAILGLQYWLAGSIDGRTMLGLQAVLTYAFSLSAVVAAPIVAVATRLVADALFARAPDRLPGILFAALATGAGAVTGTGALLFSLCAALPAVETMLAIAFTGLLTVVWIATLFLTAIRDYRRVILAYVAGIAAAAPLAWLTPPGGTMLLPLLAVVAGAVILTATLIVSIRASFPALPVWPALWWHAFAVHAQVALAGLFATMAIWVDKWIIWQGQGSVAASGMLRLNPLYDGASFLGLLSLVVGLTLILVVVETRFDRAFGRLMAGCTSHAVLARLDVLRADLVTVLLEGGRVLIVGQAALALALWVTAPMLLEAIGADPRAIIGFRFVVAGAVFHVLALYATIVLSYYDLNGRALLASAGFLAVSAVTTLIALPQGFARFGWGYMAGAIFASIVALAATGLATRDLLYLLFVGNNPAIRGDDRRWA
ncbi:exopolysaccharide Pel transporter PelG [Sphingomonas solaris]|uniref:Exopolysaccharide Pel transporter PelG n=1 Tax=Alterirhizorhabdus solaris TaxID=2529389 RepID=A0A558QW68_9SPHN|nr:exopolysaccharide Pel transporter PelG [Sphingomonas solaris]TVV71381.1 hypothetical protein FOY91_16945 [Sphingomonas solaris]